MACSACRACWACWEEKDKDEEREEEREGHVWAAAAAESGEAAGATLREEAPQPGRVVATMVCAVCERNLREKAEMPSRPRST